MDFLRMAQEPNLNQAEAIEHVMYVEKNHV